jgi:hypothetical protein
MDEVTNLSVEQLKRELVSVKRENTAALKTVEKLLKDIHKKNLEIEHLKELVSKSVPVVQPIKQIPTSPEEEIAEIQLAKLNDIAKNRSLTLEEIRAYDLLVKNKRLSQDKSTKNVAAGHFRDVSDIELIKIIGKSDDSREN